MTNEELIAKVTHFVQTGPDNHVSAQVGTPCESGIPKRESSSPLPLTQSTHYIDNPSKMR